MKSNERAMVKWHIFETILKISPTIKTGKLEDALRGQVSRTDFFNFLNVYEKNGLINRSYHGLIIYLERPTVWSRLRDLLESGFGVFDRWERRAERKKSERDSNLQQIRRKKYYKWERLFRKKEKYYRKMLSQAQKKGDRILIQLASEELKDIQEHRRLLRWRDKIKGLPD